jgi:hypothetical protein
MDSEYSKKAAAGREPSDMVFVYAKCDDGKGYEVLRQRGGEVQAGRLRRLEEGKPIHGEIIRLGPREESPALFDVNVQHDGRTSIGGPATVATDQYRRGWESIWAKRPPTHALN